MLIFMYGIPDNIVQEIALKYRFQISSDLENIGMSNVILNIPDLDRRINNCKMVKAIIKIEPQITAIISSISEADVWMRYCIGKGKFFSVNVIDEDDLRRELHIIFKWFTNQLDFHCDY